MRTYHIFFQKCPNLSRKFTHPTGICSVSKKLRQLVLHRTMNDCKKCFHEHLVLILIVFPEIANETR